MKHLTPHCAGRRGFTLIEVLVVLGIMGILMVAAYPSIRGTMENRNLDNVTRQVQTYLQQTKLLAVSTRIVHRVRFFLVDASYWAYEAERLQPDGTWVQAQGAPRKTIPNRFQVTLTLPSSGSDYIIVFSPVGTIVNFTQATNTIVIRSPRLDRPGQMDERVLGLFMGGSIQYAKRKST